MPEENMTDPATVTIELEKITDLSQLEEHLRTALKDILDGTEGLPVGSGKRILAEAQLPYIKGIDPLTASVVEQYFKIDAPKITGCKGIGVTIIPQPKAKWVLDGEKEE